ncbi:MAG: hypothetical protein AAF484_09720 [Pseudomonadota bacterium]
MASATVRNMKRAAVLVLIYALVVATTALLFSMTWPWRIELLEIAGEVLSETVSGGGFDTAQFSSDVADPRYVGLQRSLYWVQVTFIGLAFTILGMLPQRTSSIESAVNQLIAVLAGVATGKLLIGFPFLDWSTLLLWSLAGSVLFAFVLAFKVFALQR